MKRTNKPIFWSPSRYDTTKLCPMKYHFTYTHHPRINVTTSIQALGTFVHKRKEELYKGEPGNLELRFKSTQSFANHSTALWKRFVIKEDEIDHKKILWDYKGQKWAFIKEVEESCIKIYNKCASEESPLYAELPIKFEINGIYYSVKIDEIRKNFVIREYKTGKSKPQEFQLRHFPQFTFYGLALSCKAKEDKNFARICGFNEEESETFGGNPIYISEKINFEYFNVKDQERLLVTHRSDQDYHELHQSLLSLEEIIYNLDSTNIYPNFGRHCRYCQFQKPCDEKTSKGEVYGIPRDPQLKLIDIKPKLKYRDRTLRLFPIRRKKVS